MGLVGELLEKAARATPATVEDREADWWLRHTDNATWWSGATLAHGSADGLERRVVAAERFYAGFGSAARFQVCRDCAAGLDDLLAQRGYRREAPVLLLTATSATRPLPLASSNVTFRVDASLGPDWLVVLSAADGPGLDAEKETAMLRSLDLPQAYVTVLADGYPVAIGRAVVDDGWTGIFNMATTPPARRRGAARLVLAAIEDWAERRGAPNLYLQVEQSNTGARSLYDSAGFTELSRYHYRVQPRR